MPIDNPEQLLRALFQASVDAADPLKCLPGKLPPPPKGKTLVIGAGKASGAMAKAVEQEWKGELSGLIVTQYGYGMACDQIEIVEAAHPVPDQKGRDAAGRILELAKGLGEDDLCIALMSGGASSLLSLPADDLSLDDKQQVNKLLLRCGATITEMNCIRKHLSAIKGGRLAAAAAPARLVTLMVSDVPGDDPSVIGSGPTVPDASTFEDARGIVEKYNLQLPASVAAYLEEGVLETPKQGDTVFANSTSQFIALPSASLKAATVVAEGMGLNPVVLGDDLEGESREVAAQHAELALQISNGQGPVSTPAVILSGGETTVTLKGSGRGGRNSEFILALAKSLEGAEGIYGIACDTDGIDGSEDNAGAIVTPDTLARAIATGVDTSAYLDDNNAYEFFEKLGDLVKTGPTYTNVNDFRAVLVLS